MSEIDFAVRSEDARPYGLPDRCFYCRRLIGDEHAPDCVISSNRAVDAVPRGAWQPIETLPDGHHVLLFFPVGERGIGGIEAGMIYRNDGGDWSYWTHGGPNSGADWDPYDNERPTHWMRLPEQP